jgi:hypothetical protein
VKKLTIGQMAKQLNVTKTVLEQMEQSGKLVPERDKNGRRQYSEEQLEFLRSYIISQKSLYRPNKDNIMNKIENAVFQLAKGLLDMQKMIEKGYGWQTYSKDWVLASQTLSRLSMELGCSPFPTNLFEQYSYWRKPLPKWDMPFFSELFLSPWWEEDEQILLQNNGKLSVYCEELAGNFMFDKDRHLESFKMIQEDCRDRLKKDKENGMQAEKDYCDCRSFFVPEHAVIDWKAGSARVFLSVPEKYRMKMSELYEPIPKDYIVNGKVYLCPYCGWTLKPKKGGHWECVTRKCRRIVERYSKWKVKSVNYQESLCRVKQGILEYILIPGIPEQRIFNKFVNTKGLTIRLYPKVDACDLEIQFSNGKCWLIDVKDWTNPYQLAINLKKKPPFQGFTEGNWENAFIVIPRHYDQEYMNQLRLEMNECSLNYKLVREDELYKEVEKELKENARHIL